MPEGNAPSVSVEFSSSLLSLFSRPGDTPVQLVVKDADIPE